jgi:adenylate cyclase class 2
MQSEIEAKFLRVSHNQIRNKLKQLGATCKQPMYLMKRKTFDYPDLRFQSHDHSRRLRVRDEGDKIMVNFKTKNNSKYAKEIETTVGSFDTMCELFEAIGLRAYSFQESKRETWHYKDVEVVLDEWPWLDPYIEIEGPNEAAIKDVSIELGFNWKDAKFGSVDTAYIHQYPGMTRAESIGDLSEVRFNLPLPAFLKQRLTK